MSRPVWMEKPHPLVLGAKVIAMVVAIGLVVTPFWILVATSLSPDAQVLRNGGWSLWPDGISLNAYQRLFGSGIISHAILVSIGVTLAGTAVSLIATILLAYALSRPGVFGGKTITIGVLLVFLFPPSIIPSFLMVSDLGLRNTYAALILPVAVSVFNLVILRGAFQSLPQELFESARLDGASEWRMLLSLAVPLSRGVIAVVGFYFGVSYWNNFFNSMLYLDDETRWPLQPLLRDILLQGANPDTSTSLGAVSGLAPQTTMTATVVIAVIPVMLAFPFVQRFFTKGVLSGAIKS